MATALHSMPSGVNEPALPTVAPLCELFIDRSEIARTAWAWARALAAQFGGTARDHFAEAQRQAWASARETVRETVASLDAARELHARRMLEQAAEHGAAMLLALGLPRLVGPGFVSIDPAQAGDALDSAIAALDALDAPAEDLEDDDPAEHDDPAEDDGCGEPILGARENHPEKPVFSHYFRSRCGSQLSWTIGCNNGSNDGESEAGYDLGEEQNEDGGDINDAAQDGDGDCEPYLGAAENHNDQRRWAQGDRSDAEVEYRP